MARFAINFRTFSLSYPILSQLHFSKSSYDLGLKTSDVAWLIMGGFGTPLKTRASIHQAFSKLSTTKTSYDDEQGVKVDNADSLVGELLAGPFGRARERRA